MGRLRLAESPIGTINVADYYVNVPTPTGETIKVREDYFDNLSPADWSQTMDMLEPFNTDIVMNGLFSKWRENRAERRDQRTENKLAKIDARTQGRVAVAQAGGGLGGIFKNVAGAVSNVFGKGAPSDQGSAPMESRGLTVGYQSQDVKWYQNPMVIVGGVAVLGLGAYLLTRNKNKSKK